MPISKEVADELRRMAPHWGILTTRQQIESISDYHNDIAYGKGEYLVREQAYHVYLSKDGDDKFNRRRCEIALFRVTGEISFFFLDKDAGLDFQMVDKMLSIAEEWRFLESEGLLPMLDDFDMIQEVENSSPPRTRAEILRRFMHFFKARYNYEEWDTEKLDNLRRQMFKIRRDSRYWRHKRDAQSSGMPPPEKVDSNEPSVPEVKEFDGVQAHRKLIQFRQFAEGTHANWKNIDKVLTRLMEKLLDGVREAQQLWTPQSALAQAKAFKSFGLRMEMEFGTKLFYALEHIYDSRAEMDQIAEELRHRKMLATNSPLTDPFNVNDGKSKVEKGKLTRKGRKSLPERSKLTDVSSAEGSRSMMLGNGMPALQRDPSRMEPLSRNRATNFANTIVPTKRKYSSPYDGENPYNKRVLQVKNVGADRATITEMATKAVQRRNGVDGKGDAKLVFKVPVGSKKTVE